MSLLSPLISLMSEISKKSSSSPSSTARPKKAKTDTSAPKKSTKWKPIKRNWLPSSSASPTKLSPPSCPFLLKWFSQKKPSATSHLKPTIKLLSDWRKNWPISSKQTSSKCRRVQWGKSWSEWLWNVRMNWRKWSLLRWVKKRTYKLMSW